MIYFLNRRYILSKDFSFYVSCNNSLMFIKGTCGFLIFKIPSYFFFNNNGCVSLSFLSKFFFFSFFKHFSYYYKNVFFLFFCKIKLRGLGFRIRRISKFLYRFFFNMTNYYYLHVPKNVVFRSRKKRILFFSILFLI